MSDLGNREIMAQNIQRLMDQRGIDRKKLAADLDINYTTLSEWISGNVYPRIDKIDIMANYFHVQKSDLVEKYDATSNEAAEVVAAHVDDDTPESEKEQIINFIESLKKARNQE